MLATPATNQPRRRSSPSRSCASRLTRSALPSTRGGGWSNGSRLVAEFTEIESGKQSDRPALAKAFQACRLRRAKLVIAKIDRLSRDAHFLLGLEKAGVDFVAADMPTANRLTVGIMAMVADEERRLISKRTKEALAAARARGVKLGGNRGVIISAEAREISREARHAESEARAADLAPVIAGTPSSRRHEPGRA